MGITLIELMIVITIIGLLAGLTIPTYLNARLSAHRPKAIHALTQAALRQTRYLYDHDSFAADLRVLGFPGGRTADGVYTLEFVGVPDDKGFKIRAVPTPGGGSSGIDQTRDRDCQWFTLDSRGVMASGPSPKCWG
jgi:type IV pilus assembly protein PilE